MIGRIIRTPVTTGDAARRNSHRWIRQRRSPRRSLSTSASSRDDCYVKLNTNFNDFTFERKDLVESFDKVLEYYEVQLPTHIRTKIEGLVPAHYRNDFYLSLLRSTTGVPPHKDSEIRATINIYIQGGGYSTHFYDTKNETVTGSSIQSDVHINIEDHYENEDDAEAATHYDYEDVIQKSSFKAKNGSAYLLDVTQIHSVEPFNIENVNKPDDDKNERLAFTFATAEHSFADVHRMLKETGNV